MFLIDSLAVALCLMLFVYLFTALLKPEIFP